MTMTITDPNPDEIGALLNSVRSDTDFDPGRKAAHLILLTMAKHGIRRTTITATSGFVQVKTEDEVLADQGWSCGAFHDLHSKLTLMTGQIPLPIWLKVLARLHLPPRWFDRIEFRFWRPRLPTGLIRLGVNGALLFATFRVVESGRIELELNKEPPTSYLERPDPQN